MIASRFTIKSIIYKFVKESWINCKKIKNNLCKSKFRVWAIWPEELYELKIHRDARINVNLWYVFHLFEIYTINMKSLLLIFKYMIQSQW